MSSVIVATADAVVHVEADGTAAPLHEGAVAAAAPGARRWWVADGDNRLHRIAVPGGGAAAGGTDRGVPRGAVVDGPVVTALAPVGAGLLVGTERAHLHVAADGSVTPVASFEDAPGRRSWYTPWGGPPAVRSLAVRDERTWFVNVHVGGIVRTRDGGGSWEPTLDIDLDIHEVVVDEPSGLLLAAAGAGGLLVSDDGGDTWERRTDGLHATYCRAVAATDDAVLVSAARGPSGRDAAVYRGPLDAGGPLRRCALPDDLGGNVDTGWLAAAGERAVVATEDGSVHVSGDHGERWRRLGGTGGRPVRVGLAG